MGKHVIAFLKGCLVGLVVMLLDQTFKSETWLRDVVTSARRLQSPQPPEPDVVIIKLTDESLVGYPVPGGAFHYPRQALADLIRAVNLTQPGLIVVDVFLDEPGEAAEDEALAAALVESRARVLLAQDVKMNQQGDLEPQPVLAKFTVKAEARPAFFELGEQGMVRKLVTRIDGTETLPVRAATLLGHSALKDEEKSVSVTYDWRGAEAFLQLAAEGILEVYRTDPSQVLPALDDLVTPGTVVLIAPFYRASRDFFPVPRSVQSVNGELRGSEVLGFAIRTAIKGPTFEPWSELSWPRKMFIMLLFASLGYCGAVLRAKKQERYESQVGAAPNPVAKFIRCIVVRKYLVEIVVVIVVGAVLTFFAWLDFFPPLLTILISLLFGFKMDLPKAHKIWSG